MDMQNVSSLQIPEGAVRTIHDKDNRLIWGRLAYDTKYAGDITQNGTPTPDAPVSLNVVTGEQTVKLTGKNMAQTTDCNISGTNCSMSISKGSVELRSQATNVCFDLNAGTRLGAWMPNYASAPDHHLTGNGGIYIVSFHDTSTSGLNSNTVVGVFTNKRSNSITINSTLPLRNINISLDSDEYVKAILYWIGSGTTDCTIKFKVQLEQGSTSSTYEPYQEQSYPISLGSTEFCKVGTHQDYIYKNDGDWYVHKTCEKVTFNGTENWQKNDANVVFTLADAIDYMRDGTAPISDYFVGQPDVSSFSRVEDGKIGLLQSASNNRTIIKYTSITTRDAFKTWLSSHNATVYYPLATPTDTQITDTTLISQLDAIHEWLTRYGYNATVIGNLPIIIDRANL